MKRSRLPVLLSAMLCWCAGPGIARGDDDWRPIPLNVNDVARRYNWSTNWDISFHYARFYRVLPDGNDLFVNRQIDGRAHLPDKPLVTRDSPGIDERPDGANVSMAFVPASRRLPGCGGEVYQKNDGKTAHQRDWDTLVAARNAVFEQHGVIGNTPLWEKVRLIANWARSLRLLI